MSDPLKEIKSGLHRIDSYLVEKYKHRCPEDVWTMFNGLYFRFNTHTGLRLQMSSYTTNEYWGINSLNLGQLQTLAEALPKIEENILEAESRRTLGITKALDLIKNFESKQNGFTFN